MGLHQIMGVPMAMGLIMPRSISLSKLALFDLCFPMIRYQSWGVLGIRITSSLRFFLATGNGASLLKTLQANCPQM